MVDALCYMTMLTCMVGILDVGFQDLQIAGRA